MTLKGLIWFGASFFFSIKFPYLDVTKHVHFPRVKLRSYFCPYLGIYLCSKIPSFVQRKKVASRSRASGFIATSFCNDRLCEAHFKGLPNRTFRLFWSSPKRSLLKRSWLHITPQYFKNVQGNFRSNNPQCVVLIQQSSVYFLRY